MTTLKSIIAFFTTYINLLLLAVSSGLAYTADMDLHNPFHRDREKPNVCSPAVVDAASRCIAEALDGFTDNHGPIIAPVPSKLRDNAQAIARITLTVLEEYGLPDVVCEPDPIQLTRDRRQDGIGLVFRRTDGSWLSGAA